MECNSRIYLGREIEEIDWEALGKAKSLRHFFESFKSQTSKYYIQNSQHQIGIAIIQNICFPFTIGKSTKEPASYLLSLITQYFDYAQEEVLTNSKYTASQKRQGKLLIPFLKAIGKLMAMEKVVLINNYLFSTNLYPQASPKILQELVKLMQQRFKNHTLIFKTVNENTDVDLLKSLTSLKGKDLVCRQIYILDTSSKHYNKKRALIQDKKLWEKRLDYQWEKRDTFNIAELKTILSYYQDLYVKKHSKHNPVYTVPFLEAAIKSKLLDIHVLVKQSTGEIKAVQGIWQRDNILTTPFIGYDQNEPINTGLYRLMSLQLICEAEKNESILNMSSGAASFKRLRGGKPCFEYHVVFDSHLPMPRRWLWDFLKVMSEKYVKPNMEKMKV